MESEIEMIFDMHYIIYISHDTNTKMIGWFIAIYRRHVCTVVNDDTKCMTYSI